MITTWDITVADLKEFGKYATERAELALSPSAPRVPGDSQCRWCKAKGNCQQLATFVEETISAEFDVLDDDGLDVEELTDVQARSILDNKKLITSFLDAVEARVFATLDGGDDFPGYKMVAGRSNRTWTDDAEAYLKKLLKGKAYNKKLIGVGEAERLLGKGKVDDVTYKPQGKPTIAPADDKRPAIGKTDVTEEFDVVE